MYEDYYRFRFQPFGLAPDPECLFKSDSHQQALDQLLRGIRRREGMLLLTGDVGTGKTATPEMAQAIHAFIRERLRALYGATADGKVLVSTSFGDEWQVLAEGLPAAFGIAVVA